LSAEDIRTIAAIATARGRAGIAVVRVSGADAFRIARALTGRVPAPGRIAVCSFRAPDGTMLDDGVMLSFQAPASYTGEDVVEFQCHGGAVVPRRVLNACLASGARLARRGEFTQRAFLNGKLDYDQAESVLDLIDAKTERAAAAAYEGLSGRRMRACRALYDEAVSLSSEVEHALDVDEGDLPPSYLPSLNGRFATLGRDVDAALRRLREGKILRTGARVVLAGPPNAGKSSLMNALLGENRVLVSDVPGTTRDSIEEWLDVDGWPVRLVDTAGVHETDDALERAGVRRAEALVADADLVIRLGPVEVSCDTPVIDVQSKCDCAPPDGSGRLRVSAHTGEGIDALRAAIAAALVRLADAPFDDEAESCSPEEAALMTAKSQIDAFGSVSAEVDLVLLGNVLHGIAETLGGPLGAIYTSDLLDALFSRFCVGK